MVLVSYLTYFEFMAIGLGVGAFGTLIGAGGGFVLMPILILLYPEQSPDLLTSVSLAVVFLNALSGSEAYARMRRIDYRSAVVFALATIPGSVLGAVNTAFVPRRLFDAILAVALIAGAIALMVKPGAKPAAPRAKPGSRIALGRQVTRHIVEANGVSHEYTFNIWLGAAVSVAVGYISSFLGIGGGIIHVPVLVYLLNFPVHIATATSHFILVIMALAGTVTHMITGAFSHGVHHIVALAIGVIAGAQIGALASDRIKGKWIIICLAGALGLVGVRILLLVVF
ncbi:MAG: sulfite exporter TauE/SafE family protein [Desulfarculus sp.]|nr:sulfite exporter TauE/SafE family protein [Desulfarculus sp.]